MAGVSGLLILISVITGTASFIALIRPLPGLWLPTRKRAAIAWVASFVLLFIGAALSPNPKPEELAPPTEVASEVTGVVANREEDPDAMNIGNNEQETPCIPRELSVAATELVRLYDQLHAFKDDPEFIRVGFVPGGPYSAWFQATERHRDENSGAAAFKLFDEVGFMSGDLLMLGMDYVGENLSESELSSIEFFERKIQAGLALTRCAEPGSEWKEVIGASSAARQLYVAEANVQRLARESLLGRSLTDEELAFERLRGVLEAGQYESRSALAELRPLVDRMRKIGEQRKQEYEAALARFGAATVAAEQGHGTYTASLAAGETLLALATAISAEMLAIERGLAEVEATAPQEVAALAATARMDVEEGFALFKSSLAELREQMNLMRALVGELSIDEHSTPRSRVTLEMMGDARLAIKNSDDGIVMVSIGGTGGEGNWGIYVDVLRGTSVLHAKELGENAVRIVERLWSDMVPADYTIVVSRTGLPARSSREIDERIIVEGSKGRFESDISWR